MLYFSLVPGSEWCRKSSELGVPDMWTGKKLIDLRLRNNKSDLKEKEMTDCSFYDLQLKKDDLKTWRLRGGCFLYISMDKPEFTQ